MFCGPVICFEIMGLQINFLPAHAHRHERHYEVVVVQMNRIHGFRVNFYHLPAFPGLGFGTVFHHRRIGCQGFQEPNLSALLNKNQTPFCKEGSFDLWGQR